VIAAAFTRDARRESMRKKSQRSELTEATRAARPQLSATNLERAGDHNQRVTLQASRANGAVTRTALASMTALTPAAIANITKRLLRERMISATRRLRGACGQPATKLVTNAASYFSVGLNIDRDHITVVLLDSVGNVRARASRRSRARQRPTMRRQSGAAILPSGERFLPTRFALLKTT
jgi:hypothetical protein